MFDDFYGLTGRPFQLTPDPAFYFPSGTHRKALSYLRYGPAQGEGFIVITGEVGAGKSTLVAHLVASIDPAQLTVGQVVTSKLDEDEIVHVVAQSFGLAVEGHDKASALGAIEGFLHEEARAGRRCLLVVDESQNLTVSALEELRMLSNFQLGAHPLLQTLLLGQPEFRTTLQGHSRARAIAPARDRRASPRTDGCGRSRALRAAPPQAWSAGTATRRSTSACSPSFTKLRAAFRAGSTRSPTRLLLLGAVEQRTQIDGAMLQQVLAEMESDNAFPAAAPAPMPKTPRRSRFRPEPQAGCARLRRLSPRRPLRPRPRSTTRCTRSRGLAERDTQIAELQQAVVELTYAKDDASADAASPEIAALHERVAQLEARLIEQERTMRHTLTMLIEWIESDDGSQIAA